MKYLKRPTKKEGGATLVEYALIVALLAIAVAVMVIAVQTEINAAFQAVVDCLQDPTTCPTGD